MTPERFAQLSDAVAQLDAEGLSPSTHNVHAKLGGSYPDVVRDMRAFRSQAAGGPAVDAPAVDITALLASTAVSPEVLATLAAPPLVPEVTQARPPLPQGPLALARRDWVAALRAVAAFERQPRPRGRAQAAAHHARHVELLRQHQSAESRWRPLEMTARQALATFLAWQAQQGRGNAEEQARCREAIAVAQAELAYLTGTDETTCITTVQTLLEPPIIDGVRILPPMA